MAEQIETPSAEEKKSKGFRAVTETMSSWSLSRKIALVAVAAISLGLFAFIIIQARTADYQLLYGNLGETDASSVVQWLKGQNIPYKLANGGRSIMIPAANVYEARLELAAQGLPQGGGVGFEIFDKQSFALTDFVQKVNYSRALQGELSRTISSLKPVENARVHLVLPEKRLFKNQQKPATASVILKLAPGQRLHESQIEGILYLVASSIEGLTPENVTIVDQNGNVLSRAGDKGMMGKLSPDMLEYQMQVEQRLEARAQALLERSLGNGNAMVRVSASLDFARTERMEETYDPEEPVIRSEQINEEKTGSEITGGVPGVQSNLNGNTNQVAGASPPSSRSQRTTNYEISKVVSKTTNPVGTITRLSVSVLVADRVIPATDKDPAKTEPRTDAELQTLENLVASALGMDKARGDKIEVTSMPFLQSPEDPEGTVASGTLYQYLPFVRYGLILLGGALLYFLIIRPLLKTFNRDVTEHYKTVEELEAEQFGGQVSQPEEPADLLGKIKQDVDNDPIFNAHILKGWIRDQG